MMRHALRAHFAADAVPLLLGAVFLAGALVLALGWHPVEVAGAENDGYVRQAEQLLRGEVPADVWHPLHYALLVALATPLLGDAFVAGKIVSVFGGALLVFAASALARRLGGNAVALLTGAILCVQGGLVVYSVQAAADASALGIGVLALLLAARGNAAPGRSTWLAAGGAGVAGGFACGTRYPMVALLPALLLAALAQAPRGRRAAALGCGVVLGYAPQALCSWRAFGAPFHQENWRNLALKVVWNFDPIAMGDARPYTGTADVLRLHWRDLLSAGLRDLGEQFAGGLARLCCGCDSVAMVAAVLLAAFCAWRRPPARAAVAFGACYLALVCFTSSPSERWSLPVLPALALVLGALPAAASRPLLRAAAAVPAALCIALGCWQLPDRLLAFASQHPVAEIAAAAELRARLTPFDGIASAYPSMSRHVAGRFVVLDAHAFGDLAGTALLDRIEELALRFHFEFLVCSRASCATALASLRACAGRDDRACVVEEWREEVAIVRCRPPLAGVRRAAIEVGPADGRARFVVEPAPAELDGAPVATAVLRIAAPGARFTLLLERQGERFAADWSAPLAAGAWRLEPMLLLSDGSLRRGAPVEVMVAGTGDAAPRRR